MESPSVGQLTVSPVSAGYTAYLDSYMEPRLSTTGQHVRLTSFPTPARSGQQSSHYPSIRSGDFYLFDDLTGMDIDLDLDIKGHKSGEDADVKVRGLNAVSRLKMRITCAAVFFFYKSQI